MIKRHGKGKWVARVQAHSNAMDLERGVFKNASPRGIAKSILRSVRHSRRKKGTTLSSGISMMTFYANRGGKKMPVARKKKILKAKEEYRKLVGKSKKAA